MSYLKGHKFYSTGNPFTGTKLKRMLKFVMSYNFTIKTKYLSNNISIFVLVQGPNFLDLSVLQYLQDLLRAACIFLFNFSCGVIFAYKFTFKLKYFTHNIYIYLTHFRTKDKYLHDVKI